MAKFLLFVGGLFALFILMANLGPMILLGIGIWLLYVIYKQFVKSKSTGGKIGWVIVGLLVLSITVANIYAVIGVAAAYALYLIFTNWQGDEKKSTGQVIDHNDPFTNFERQWDELNY